MPACLVILHRAGWRVLLGLSWALYLWYRVEPQALTLSGFETAFPLLAWQLLFVHGIAIGYHRNDVSRFAARLPTSTLHAGERVRGRKRGCVGQAERESQHHGARAHRAGVRA